MSTTVALPPHAQSLLGQWRLLTMEIENQTTGTRTALLGMNPKGRLLLLPSATMMTVITSRDRTQPTTSDERAGAYSSVIAYTGRFTVEGDRLTTAVDVSWNEGWVHAPQVRTFRFVGTKLELTSAWAPNPFEQGSIGRGIMLWEREE